MRSWFKVELIDVLVSLGILFEEDAFFKEYKAWRWESSGDEEWSNFI